MAATLLWKEFRIEEIAVGTEGSQAIATATTIVAVVYVGNGKVRVYYV